MRTSRLLLTALTTVALVAGCSSSAATPSPSAGPTNAPASQAPAASAEATATATPTAGPPEAWTQSDIFKGFDPMSVDLTGYTPGPNGEHSTNAADVPDPTSECLAQVKGKKLAFLNGLSG